MAAGRYKKLVGEQVHEQPVVPLPSALALVAAQHADRLEPELRVRADRAVVVAAGSIVRRWCPRSSIR